MKVFVAGATGAIGRPLIKVITANFQDGKWKFSDGSSKFNATIADPVFQRKLDAREEGFYKGDVLRVILKTVQTEKPNGKIQTQHTIQEVLEHKRPGSQQRLLPPAGGRMIRFDED